jgi:hypothetical protein
MGKKTSNTTSIKESKNPPPIKPNDGSDYDKSGYNPPPIGERPGKPIVTPAPPPKKQKDET